MHYTCLLYNFHFQPWVFIASLVTLGTTLTRRERFRAWIWNFNRSWRETSRLSCKRSVSILQTCAYETLVGNLRTTWICGQHDERTSAEEWSSCARRHKGVRSWHQTLSSCHHGRLWNFLSFRHCYQTSYHIFIILQSFNILDIGRTFWTPRRVGIGIWLLGQKHSHLQRRRLHLHISKWWNCWHSVGSEIL